VAPPVFKTGLAANTVAGGFDSLPPPPNPSRERTEFCQREFATTISRPPFMGRASPL
jgi:hypothetical protein